MTWVCRACVVACARSLAAFTSAAARSAAAVASRAAAEARAAATAVLLAASRIWRVRELITPITAAWAPAACVPRAPSRASIAESSAVAPCR